jgi:hypothetical protein
MLRSGVCRFCRCWDFDPCPNVCGWADRAQTLCTECVQVNRAWVALTVSRKPNMVHAFFRGFMAGSNDERMTEQKNPYTAGETARYWTRGYDAGAAELAASA